MLQLLNRRLHPGSHRKGVVKAEKGCQEKIQAEEHCNGVLGLSAFSPVNGRLAVDNNNVAEA